ncbi:type VI secretion system Vgr family protein [Simiduia agarivorans]|uniref:Uncharacterized protein n=1 Tax=Simiduia agarivorans (strain DSM 21679 / JCM 13881 / BCRC 17597 / SA1) TaxID=1117647 RepID=K4KG86_SIMAS|nr:type VI secretion system tip protein TssI/VgrG [Simiduia agarivorans]AFU98104.1 hypothetical protein M5M_04485 [Simiduia agarivorans SA1 = DSM 21679]
MANLTQKHRLIHVNSPLGADQLIATSLNGEESISGLFRYEIELWSENHAITQKDLVGKPLTLTLNRDGQEQRRFIHGYVNQFAMLDVNAEGLRKYRAILVPGLWFASLGSNNRVFHNKTAKQIVEDVLGEYSKVVKLSLKLNASYAVREYCVQFDETDFDFVSRLMAEEGIAYYFVHSEGSLELVVTDDAQGFYDLPDSVVEYDGGGSHPAKSTIHAWSKQFAYHTGGFEFKDYNEFTPDKDHKLEIKTSNKLNDVAAYKLRTFGRYTFEQDADPKHKITDKTNRHRAKMAMESIESGHELADATSDCAAFCAGGRFELEHSLDTEKGKYLIVALSISAADGNGVVSGFQNQFRAVPVDIMPRPHPLRYQRKVNYPMVATVLEVKATGADSSQDAYTQLKVKFPWNSQQNSCWVRVQQAFSGKNWGANFVPRIGQEVIVTYLNGDPDRPIVSGAVYNATNTGPNYTSTQSGWKTEWDGSAFNELRFDDKKGAEEIFMEAGKDHNFIVHNDQKGKIENDQTIEVIKNRTLTVAEGNETHTVKKGDQTISIDSGNQALTIKKGTQTIDVKGAVKITSKASIELKVGGSSIKLTPSGIEIKGTTLKAKGDATAEVKAGGMLTIKGSLTKIN